MNEDNKPKTFDVSPPSALNSQAAVTAPKVIVKNDPMLTNAPQNSETPQQDSVTAEEAKPVSLNITSGGEHTIQPINNDLQPTTVETNSANDETQEKETGFESSDALPDTPTTIDNKSADISETQQQPKIYDTKEYFVPIHETNHSHGFVKGSLVAGFVAAISVLAVVAFLATQVNK